MKITLVLILSAILIWGCARVTVQTPKEPIKVDISMRLDVYQHIVKDIDEIENIVSGTEGESKSSEEQSLLDYFVCSVYAQEGIGQDIEQAALRRRDRRAELVPWQEKGVIGENQLGLLEIRDPESTNPSLEQLVNEENSDRMIIYNAVAKKNNTSVEEVQKIYAERLQNDAPSGTAIEALNKATGVYEWSIK